MTSSSASAHAPDPRRHLRRPRCYGARHGRNFVARETIAADGGEPGARRRRARHALTRPHGGVAVAAVYAGPRRLRRRPPPLRSPRARRERGGRGRADLSTAAVLAAARDAPTAARGARCPTRAGRGRHDARLEALEAAPARSRWPARGGELRPGVTHVNSYLGPRGTGSPPRGQVVPAPTLPADPPPHPAPLPWRGPIANPEASRRRALGKSRACDGVAPDGRGFGGPGTS